MRWIHTSAAIVFIGCGGHTLPGLGPDHCSPIPPASAEYVYSFGEPHPAFAGEFRLEQVQTQPEGPKLRSGMLHLREADSAERAVRGPRVVGLLGWFDPENSDSAGRRVVSSRMPQPRRAQLVRGTLRIGQIGVLDGVGDNLRITARNENGFWGWWIADEGLAVPVGPNPAPVRAGYFCADRVRHAAQNSAAGR